MKLIYVAHPYGGDPDNLENIKKLINDLTIDYPDDYVFISPGAALGRGVSSYGLYAGYG